MATSGRRASFNEPSRRLRPEPGVKTPQAPPDREVGRLIRGMRAEPRRRRVILTRGDAGVGCKAMNDTRVCPRRQEGDGKPTSTASVSA
jgi:hypothetical protein